MTKTKIVNIRTEPCDIKIDRTTKWGNPFKIGRDGSREEVIAKYRHRLWNQIRSGAVTKEEILELRGKRLGCWCKPLPCHGDVLLVAIQIAEDYR